MKHIQVKVGKCYLNLNSNAKYCLCLRVGKYVSQMTQERDPNNGVIQFNQQLKISVNQITLKTSPKCSIAIYIRRENQQRKIIGMVTIKVDQAKQFHQNMSYDKYKIQQSPDRTACLQAVMQIFTQLPENQANNMTAISSLTQIRDMHQILSGTGNQKNFNQTGGFKFSSGSGFYDPSQHTKKISEIQIPSKVQSPPKSCKCHQYQQIIETLSEQLHNYKNKAVHFQKLCQQAIAQNKNNGAINVLQNLEQNNCFLKQIVSIQQKKNLLSNKFITEVLRLLQIPAQQIKMIKGNLQLEQTNPFKPYQYSSTTPIKVSNNYSEKSRNAEFGKDSRQSIPTNNKQILQYQDQIKRLIKQKDQFFELSQDLYRQVNAQKQFKKDLTERLKEKQINQLAYEEAVQKLKYEIDQLKKKSSSIHSTSKPQSTNDRQLQEQKRKNIQSQNKIKELQDSNKQFERKFLETLKGLQQFKKDALNARQQLINKQAQIDRLNEQLNKPIRQQTQLKKSKDLLKQSGQVKNGKQNNPVIDSKLIKLLQKSIDMRNQKQKNKTIVQNGARINEDLIRKAKIQIDSSYSKLLSSQISKEQILNQKRTISKILDTYLFKL